MSTRVKISKSRANQFWVSVKSPDGAPYSVSSIRAAMRGI